MADFVVEDRWSFDSGTGLWTCGELVIGLEANDPTRWYVKTPAVERRRSCSLSPTRRPTGSCLASSSGDGRRRSEGARRLPARGRSYCICSASWSAARRRCSGPAAERPVTALIFSEEPDDSMREKVEACGLERAFIMFGWELAGRTWADKVAVLVALAQHRGHDILFVDNTSRAAQIEDEGGVEFARAVEKLQEACRTAGLTLIIDVHHKKGRDSIENKTRGGTGVQGAVDINVEVERVGGHSSRKRRLTAFGRVRATNWQKVIELSADGREYALATDDHTEVDEETQIAFMGRGVTAQAGAR